MKISQEDVILIKNFYLSKQYGARRLLRELPDEGWKLWRIDNAEEKPQDGYKIIVVRRFQAAVDHVCRVAVKDLVLSQEDKQKRHRSGR